jgi:4-hydroxy-2-oxoheptanedioate aldolase
MNEIHKQPILIPQHGINEMFKKNGLKRRVAQNLPSLGIWVSMADPVICEIAGHAGYDFAIIDLEHGMGDLKDAVNMLRVLSAFETTAMVRVPGHDGDFLKRVLDAGAQTLMVPMVETADQAREIVSACRYPPLGKRGYAAPGVRASGYGNSPDYVDQASEELFIALQIESVLGVDNAAEIAAVDGVDLIFIGAADLSGSMNMLAETGREEVAEQISRCVAAVKSVGKPLGTIPRPDRNKTQLLEDGFIVVTGGVDVAFLRNAANEEVGAFQDQVKSS